MFFKKKDPSILRPGEGGSPAFVWIIALVAVIAVIFAIIYLVKPFGTSLVPDMAVSEGTVDASGYQAVFLTNGQVYFGKVTSSLTGQFVDVEDVYYLQVAQAAETDPAAQQGTSLVKLGSEMHGPEDDMQVNRDQILFVEQLRADSKIVEAIQSYQAAE